MRMRCIMRSNQSPNAHDTVRPSFGVRSSHTNIAYCGVCVPALRPWALPLSRPCSLVTESPCDSRLQSGACSSHICRSGVTELPSFATPRPPTAHAPRAPRGRSWQSHTSDLPDLGRVQKRSSRIRINDHPAYSSGTHYNDRMPSQYENDDRHGLPAHLRSS